MKKIKTLLINPYIEDFTAYDLWLKPYGLYKLSYAFKKKGFDVSFIDLLDMSDPSIPLKFKKMRENGTRKFYFEYIPRPEILPKIDRKFKRYGLKEEAFKEKLKKIKKIDCVFITSTICYWYTGISTTIKIIREVSGNVPVVLGGIYPTLYPEHSKITGADFIVKGYFEENLPEILKEIFNIDINFDFEIYPDYSISKEKISMPVFLSKGCPYKCNYCASNLIDPIFVQYPLNYILKNFENLKKIKTKNIAFYDDALLFKNNHIKTILNKLIEKNLNFNFHTPNGMDPNEIDKEMAKLFKESNFKTIRLSVDSLNEKIKYEKLKKIMENFFKSGYKIGEIEAYLLIGFPEEKFEEIKESLILLNQLGIKSRFAYFSPIKGTKIWEILKVKGYVNEDEDPLLSNKLLFPYRFNGINPDQLKLLKNIQNNLNQKL